MTRNLIACQIGTQKKPIMQANIVYHILFFL